MKIAAAISVLVLAAVVLAGCGGGGGERSTGRPTGGESGPRPVAPLPPTCQPGLERALGSRRLAYAAVVRAHARAYRAAGRRPFADFGPTNENGHATVFGVRAAVQDAQCEATWYRVALPMRPNGVTGYVRAKDVELGVVRTRIIVDLSARRLTLYRNGRPVLRANAAIGAPSTPTPIGRFYVNQRLIPGDPTGPFGPAAIGISAFSDVLTNWAQGGPIAIHGTDSPASIGRPASHGCIRLDNRAIERLFAATPAGTPVVIRA